MGIISNTKGYRYKSSKTTATWVLILLVVGHFDLEGKTLWKKHAKPCYHCCLLSQSLKLHVKNILIYSTHSFDQ